MSEQREASAKGITKSVFFAAFQTLPQGNPEKAWGEFVYALFEHKDFMGKPVDGLKILEQWKEYAMVCEKEGTQKKYIKTMEKWIASKDYLIDYKSKSGISYLDKYKKLK